MFFVYEVRCIGERNFGVKLNGFRRKIYFSVSFNSGDIGSEGGDEWVDFSEEEFFFRIYF